MVLLFILYSVFIHANVLARPLQHPTFEILLYPREDPNRFTSRSEWSIVWSCLTTIFACLWVAVHPNIPAPSGSIFLTRLKLMGGMLIAPELVIAWAARQWYAAHHIAGRQKHKDRGWTITHGFFASMGGFMLYDNGVMKEILGIEDLERLESEEKIDWPTISEKEIRDKSKGDFVSKGLAILQTTWFTVQCIARHIVGLNITQLELATLAFAVLNIILYILWWHKPLGVACPVPVHLRHPTTLEAPLAPPSPPLSHHHPSAFARFRAYFSKKFKEGLSGLVCIFIIKPFMIIVYWVDDTMSCNRIVPAQLSVPTFYAPDSPNLDFAVLIGLIVGVVFGGIHCIAWSFGFPSAPEEYIWRASAIAITSTPFILCFALVIIGAGESDFITFVGYCIPAFAIPVYCFSRAALLILPFLALRLLPPGSLLDFKWSSFIPHV